MKEQSLNWHSSRSQESPGVIANFPRMAVGCFLVVAGSLALVICGCDSQFPAYPADLKYQARTEPLVVSPPSSDPARLDRPGELPLMLSMLNERDRQGVVDPDNLTGAQRSKLEELLDGVFGTPVNPRVNAKGVKGIEEDTQGAVDTARQQLALDDETLARGSSLYRVHCLHCHGLTGNGRGPTSAWVNPHPRDYRQGIFKFTSTSQSDKDRKARREDLFRTIQQGVEGTSMPSFTLLPKDQIDALISYVIHLSMRGQLEFNVMKDMLGENKDADLLDRANGNLAAIARWWVEAQSALIRPDPAMALPTGSLRAQSIQNGFRLFRETTAAGCIGCHTDYGRQPNYKYDAWGTIVRPTDLTSGVYRGGRRPLDLYWRIHSGVNGANMAAFSNLLDSKAIWDLVNFLEVLPYPQMRKEYGIEID
jgi:mono/diheme cytochrome c family protein